KLSDNVIASEAKQSQRRDCPAFGRDPAKGGDFVAEAPRNDNVYVHDSKSQTTGAAGN
ncbi:MAG: hypothetical protein UY81_C0036G0006, partial [Candidatus Giovannonibacteria bacterium GW2011_GWA2_53_7]